MLPGRHIPRVRVRLDGDSDHSSMDFDKKAREHDGGSAFAAIVGLGAAQVGGAPSGASASRVCRARCSARSSSALTTGY